jgi:hypothetical protein
MANLPQKKGPHVAHAPAISVTEEVASHLLNLPHVVNVFIKNDPNACLVWTAVDQFTPEVRDSIYAVEEMLVKRYPSLPFSFRVVQKSTMVDIGSAERYPRTA